MSEPAIDSTAEDLGAELVPQAAPETPAATTLFHTDDPVEVVERASRVANALKSVLVQQGMIQRIGQGEHVRVEGWQTLGGMLGVVPVVVWTRRVQDPDGWEAKVEARTLDGRIVGAGEAQCDRGESRWKKADEHAIRSMAQTRATSKALAAPLRFVIKLAGFEGTPAEEMPPPDTGYGRARPERSPGSIVLEHASGRLTAIELVNLLREHRGGKPIDISEKDAQTRLQASIDNVRRDEVSALIAKIDRRAEA